MNAAVGDFLIGAGNGLLDSFGSDPQMPGPGNPNGYDEFSRQLGDMTQPWNKAYLEWCKSYYPDVVTSGNVWDGPSDVRVFREMVSNNKGAASWDSVIGRINKDYTIRSTGSGSGPAAQPIAGGPIVFNWPWQEGFLRVSSWWNILGVAGLAVAAIWGIKRIFFPNRRRSTKRRKTL